MKTCRECGINPVVLITGWKCTECIGEVDRRFRIRRQLSAFTRGGAVAQVLQRDGRNCRYCGVETHIRRYRDAQSREIDHVVPARAGGSGHPDNLAMACLGCNRIKAGREYVRTRALVWYIEHEADPAVKTIYQSRGLCA